MTKKNYFFILDMHGVMQSSQGPKPTPIIDPKLLKI